MAKLGSYYGLCPLIDHRSILGICQDAEPGNVIVTLGKNIAIKYRLHDQKQLLSWRTKDKFSSPIIYDADSKMYVAAFNEQYLRMWDNEAEELDKLKKYKFKTQIHTIFSHNSKTYIVFSSGDVVLLADAVDNRKEYEPRRMIESATIWDVKYASLGGDLLVGILCYSESNDGIYLTWWVVNKEKQFPPQKLHLKREGQQLQGYMLHSNKNESVQLITLWSDNRIYTYKLNSYPTTQPSPPELFAVIETVSCQHLVTMISLNDDYIVIYGASANEEGAIVVIYNLQFKVTQSKQTFKLFTMGARLWRTENNLLVCVGQNLAVIPFRLETEQIAALVGSHKVALEENCDVAIVHSLESVAWENEAPVEVEGLIPEEIREKVVELSTQGLGENQICEDIVPEFIKKKNVAAVSRCLDYFVDLPEVCLAKLLKFSLTAPATLFKNGNKSVGSACLQPLERCILTDKILTKSFSDALLLPHLRTELDLSEILLLLQYISHLLSDEGHFLPALDAVQTESKLIEWSCVLLDSNYQKFLLSRDGKVLETVSGLLEIVGSHLGYLNDLRGVVPLLAQVQKGKTVNKTNNASFKYSVEQVQLY